MVVSTPWKGKVDAAASKEQLADYATTVSVAQTYATKGEMTTDDRALRARINGLSSKVDAAASKEQLGDGGKEPDLSGFATKQEMQSADSALGGWIDGLAGKVNAVATKAELGAYLTTEAAGTT